MKKNDKDYVAGSKSEQMQKYKVKNTGPGKEMNSDSGYKISNDSSTLKAGRRGPLLFRDTHFYRKISKFNRERIPEKVVHARGFGVYGEFELTKSMSKYTIADFLQTPGTKTPVFTRFSTFVGSKGSKDTAVDIRGFATKFYTQEGNYDMLSLQFPVFILNDAIKFMDVAHAAKPNPVTDVPQATTAHDNFWDYVVSNQESAHMVMWLMSLRGRPRSWRMMEGWPINTFILVNEAGTPTFVRFNWKPILGVHSLLLDEANILGGVDPDFHRNDIIEAINKGVYPAYDLGVQLIPFEDEFKHDFDVLDDTKLWPEEVVPVEVIGRMTLNRLVNNFFSEEEQSSFDPATLVPGIEFSNDPVLQGRAFAYRDTDYHRLGTGNINEIPINRPITTVNTNNRDGYSKYRIDVDRVHFHNNTQAGNTPAVTPGSMGGYVHFPQKVEGYVTREFPSDSFNDHFSQPRMFWNSLAPFEKNDLIESFSFHLQNVKNEEIRQKNVEMWANVDVDMASYIAENIGVNLPRNCNVNITKSSPSLSMANTLYLPDTQKVGVLIGNDFDDEEVRRTIEVLNNNNVFIEIVSEKLGYVIGKNGSRINVNGTFTNKYSVMYDSLYIVGGTADDQEIFNENIKAFFKFAYKHYKPIGIASTGLSNIKRKPESNYLGVILPNTKDFPNRFLEVIAKQRFWSRQ